MQLVRQTLVSWRMLTHQLPRFILSVLGISFSVLIMFMQLGFFNGLNDSQANLPPFFDCDLIMSHPEKNHLKTGEEFHRLRLQQAASVEGVEAVSALYTAGSYWWNPQDGSRNRVLIIGVNLDRPMLRFPALREYRDTLRRADTILYDRLSRRELGSVQIGTRSRLYGRPVEVVGLFELGPNFSYEGHILTSDHNFFRLFGKSSGIRDRVDLGLIRAEPGVDPEVLRQRLFAALPNDFILLTPSEIYKREVSVTTRRSPSGVVFGIGLLVGFTIGIIICYQILFNEITDNLSQFATLKAIGYPARHLAAIVIGKALILSVIGFLPGLAAGFALYGLLESLTQIKMFLTPGRILLVFALSAGMCLIAALLSLRTVIQADPADLF